MAFLNKRILVTSFLYLCFVLNVLGQAVIQNKRFSYYAENYGVLNPAHIGTGVQRQLNVQYLSFTGVRKIIRTFNMSGFYHVKESKSTIGLSAYSESQGRFLQDNNLSASFSFNLFESEEHALYAGGTFGLVNYIVKDNEFGFGGNDWGVDAGMGVWYKRQGYEFGLAYTHLFNTVLVPVSEQFALDKSINFSASSKYVCSKELDVIPHLVIQSERISGLRAQLLSTLVYRKKFLGLLTIHSEGSLAIGAGMQNFNWIGSGLIGFNFSMNLNFNKALVINSNQFEMGLRYYLNQE